MITIIDRAEIVLELKVTLWSLIDGGLGKISKINSREGWNSRGIGKNLKN